MVGLGGEGSEFIRKFMQCARKLSLTRTLIHVKLITVVIKFKIEADWLHIWFSTKGDNF